MKAKRAHADLMVEYAQDASLKCWRYLPLKEEWELESYPEWYDGASYFVGHEKPTKAPRPRRTAGETGIWFEAPLNEAPPEETKVYMVHMADSRMYHAIRWNSKDLVHQLLLKRNLLFYKAEDAVACAKAMLKLIENDF